MPINLLKQAALFFLILLAPLACASSSPKMSGGMMFIKGGCFQMGSLSGMGLPDEKPERRVCLDDFWLDRYEVTQKQFSNMLRSNPSRFRGCENCPVENVSWFKAETYCSFVGKSLPTEAQWEYAAKERGGQVEYGFGGASITKKDANYKGSGPTPVGRYQPNSLGLFDMAGNVREWVSDWYDPGFYRVSPLKNPKGPQKGELKVLRGGYWGDDPENLRVTAREKAKPAVRHFENGFRCAKRKRTFK